MAPTGPACWGLPGEVPDKMDPDRVVPVLVTMSSAKTVQVANVGAVAFDPATDIIFDYGPPLRGHANGMIFSLRDAHGHAAAV